MKNSSSYKSVFSISRPIYQEIGQPKNDRIQLIELYLEVAAPAGGYDQLLLNQQYIALVFQLMVSKDNKTPRLLRRN